MCLSTTGVLFVVCCFLFFFCVFFVFFFQAEDGIRDVAVTGVQTCALPICASRTLRLPKVQQYMQQRVAQTLGLGAVSASKRLIELSTGARSEYVQLEASRDILDRVGLRAPDKVSHNIQGDIKINIDLT